MRKTLLLAFAIVAFGIVAGATWATLGTGTAETLPLQRDAVAAADAAAHVGETATVEGMVNEVHVSPRATFLNLGGRYPSEVFAGVIFSDDTEAFPNVQAYAGKTVDITGTVQMYDGRPEIILRSPSQIRME